MRDFKIAVCKTIVVFFLFAAAGNVWAEASEKGKLELPKNWKFDVGLKRFLLSHTSYEFGSPEVPFSKPLSRLEFPLDTWWLNLELRRTCPRWSTGLRAGFTIDRNTQGWMRDSDWTDPFDTKVRTIYSKSRCRAEANYSFRGDVDVNISDWLRLPKAFEIRPLFAFEFQRFNLMAHDGVQWETGVAPVALAGDGLHFRQDYYMYQIGARGVYDGFKIGKYIDIKLHGEADWGPVRGYNEDRHLYRAGRITEERTVGSSYYFLTGVDLVIAKTITAGVTMDYLKIRTSGTHRWKDPSLNVDQEWSDNVNVWSDQTSLMAHVSYAF